MPQRTAPLAGPTIAVAPPSASALAVESTAASFESPTAILGHVFTKEPLRGAAGVRVRLSEERGDEPPADVAATVTDASGCFRMAGLKGGARYVLTPSVPTGSTEPESESFVFEPSAGEKPHVFFWVHQTGAIIGTVSDATPDYSKVDFDACAQALEAQFHGPQEAAAEGYRVLKATDDTVCLPRPVPNAVVTVRGESLVRQAATDMEGRFECAGLPFGEYEVSAAAPTWMLAGGKSVDPATARITLDGAEVKAELVLRTDLVVVRGHIIDDLGRGVPGARVTTIFDKPLNSQGRPTEDRLTLAAHEKYVAEHSRSTVSDPNGYYTLFGPGPKCIFDWSSPGDPGYFGLSVEVQGMVQRKEDVPRVMNISDTHLAAERRLVSAYAPIVEQSGRATAEEVLAGWERWESELSRNRVDGAVIIDIVLYPAGTPSP